MVCLNFNATKNGKNACVKIVLQQHHLALILCVFKGHIKYNVNVKCILLNTNNTGIKNTIKTVYLLLSFVKLNE